MGELTEHGDPRANRRLEIEAILAGYPSLSDNELEVLCHWFKQEASALDVALVASNAETRDSYIAFRKEHIDRFTAIDVLRGLAFAAIVSIIAFGLVWQIL